MTVALSCQFGIITPIISNVIGGTILVSAETTYPVKEGVVATVPGGGAPIIPIPVAKFTGSPQTGWGPSLQVKFTNESTGAPATQTWLFAYVQGGTGTGTVSPATSYGAGTQTVTYGCTGVAGDTCTFGVSLQVSNAGGSDSEVKPADYITLTVPQDPPLPIAEFTGTDASAVDPRAAELAARASYGRLLAYLAARARDVAAAVARVSHRWRVRRPAQGDGQHRRHEHVDQEGLHRHQQQDLHGAGLRQHQPQQGAANMVERRLHDDGAVPAR